MSELYPTDAALNSLSGLSDAEQEVLFIPIGEAPYYTSFYKMLYRLLDVARRAGDLRVYKDGELTFGVRGGRFHNGAGIVTCPGSAGNALTDNATNYIYLDASGSLVTSTTGMPAAATVPHIPLATVVATGGGYAIEDIDDLRGTAMYQCLSGMTPAGGSELVGGGATTLHRHDAHGLSEAVRAAMPTLSITAGTISGSVIPVSVQCKDAAGNDLPQRMLVRVWISESDWGTPTDMDMVSLTGGTLLRAIIANGDYEIITGPDGLASMTIESTPQATRYVLAEIDGRVYSSGPVQW